jgi:hypothetical protein
VSKATLRGKVRKYVRDTAGVLLDPDYDGHLEDAVAKYSRHRPRVLVRDLVAGGSFDVPLPEEWEEDFSELREVEHPVGERVPNLRDRREFRVYAAPEGSALRFLEGEPGAGEVVRVTITAPHSITEDATSVRRTDLDTLVYLAAGLACMALAARYASTNDPTILADSVDYQSKSSEFAKRGKEYMGMVARELPELVSEIGTAVKPAAAETSFENVLSYLTHP